MANKKKDQGPGQRPMKLAEALLVRADQKKKATWTWEPVAWGLKTYRLDRAKGRAKS